MWGLLYLLKVTKSERRKDRMETKNKPMESIIDLIWTPEEDDSLIEERHTFQPPSIAANCGNGGPPIPGRPALPTIRIC